MSRVQPTARKTNRPLTVLALVLAIFMAAMEMTVVSTAMPTVVAELGGALHYAWVFSAYMLALTVMVPIYGKLADLYGRKPVMLVSIAIFLVGSIMAARAQSMTSLIVFRVIQGIGAGGMQPIAITVAGDIFDLEERARVQGAFAAVWGIAGLVGPLLGGIFVATLSWRWVFYINIPFCLVSAAILFVALHESIEKKPHTLDIAGAVLLSFSVVALLLGIEGLSPVLLLISSGVALALFLFVELRAKEPMLSPRLFMRRVLATASALSGLGGAIMIGMTTFLPLYAQGVLGSTPTEAGACIAPMAVSWPLASVLSGRLLTRVGFRPLVRTGMIIVSIGAIVLAFTMMRGASATELKIAAIIFGLGMGLANTAQVIAVQTSVSFNERGVATASTMFFRSIGGTIGVGVMGVVLSRTLIANPIMREADAGDLVARILGPERKNVPASILAAISGDLERGLSRVAWICVGLAAVALLVSWVFPHIERKKASPPATPSPSESATMVE